MKKKSPFLKSDVTKSGLQQALNGSEEQTRSYYEILTYIFFIFGIGLRLLIFWNIPPTHFFDNHYEPIFLIIKNGTIPLKNACWQCYQPPVFYYVSAMVGKLLISMGANAPKLFKMLQFITTLSAILTLGVVYLILKHIRLSNFSKVVAFGTVCFLPRHIYMSALHSNDTISYLFVALCVYLTFVAIEKKLSPPWLAALSLVITITIFTKATALVVIPMVLTAFGIAFVWQKIAPRKIIAISLILLMLMPMGFLSYSIYTDKKIYGKYFPGNQGLLNVHLRQRPGKGKINYFDFKPWASISTPILAPDNIESFWTVIYSGMWFDTEPMFIIYTDRDDLWWKHYFLYLDEAWYDDWPSTQSLSGFTLFTGSALIALGLIPLFLILVGGFYPFSKERSFQEEKKEIGKIKIVMLQVLFLFNAAGTVFLTLKAPFFSSMKASYMLNSIPAYTVLLGYGITLLEKHRSARWGVVILFGLLFSLVIIHLFHIIISIRLTFR